MIVMSTPATAFEALLPAERPRLIRLCASLTGNYEVAEDLTQETLYEAWRHLHKIHDASGLHPWLSAIARNVCLRWRSNCSRVASPSIDLDPEDWAADDSEIDRVVERQELVDVLDRVLDRLPSETREILINYYVDELPQAEIAAIYGLSAAAVKMRLYRGRLRLLDDLTKSLPSKATDAWHETRIWCPSCGHRRLLGRFDQDNLNGRFSLKCPDCHPNPQFLHSQVANSWGILGTIRTFKPALNRIAKWVSNSYQQILLDGSLACPNCGRQNSPRLHLSEALPSYARRQQGIHVWCDTCGIVTWENTLSGLLLSLPATNKFWLEHPRIQTLPQREMEIDGAPAIVTTYASLTNSDQLDVVVAADTFRILAVHGVPAPHHVPIG